MTTAGYYVRGVLGFTSRMREWSHREESRCEFAASQLCLSSDGALFASLKKLRKVRQTDLQIDYLVV